MRRKDREVTDQQRIREIAEACHCCRLGFADGGSVYIVPLNYGYTEENGNYTFYFHSAKKGRKIDLIAKNPMVGFEMDTNYAIKEHETACEYSARFQSIIGEGKVSFVEDEAEKVKALQAIMKHNTGKDDWEFHEKMLQAVRVIRMDVTKISCKESR